MLKRIVLAAILFIAPPIAAAKAEGFLLGLAVGGMLFGGNQHGGGGTSVLYSAEEEVLKKTDPLSVKLIASHEQTCFNSRSTMNVTLGGLFNHLTRDFGQKERTILQIVRVFNTSTVHCASIWYAYVEK